MRSGAGTPTVAAASLALALLGGGVGTVPADAAPPPFDTLEGATPEQRGCITRNDGTKRAAVSAWRRPEPRYKAYRAVLDAAYERATGDPYHYNAPIAGVPFGLLGHGLDEQSGRVILLVDPKLIDPDPFARHPEKVACRANAYRKLPDRERISVAVQRGCFSAKQIEGLRDRMRGSRLMQRVARDVEFDSRLHVLVHVDDRPAIEAIRRREGPILDVYWTTRGRSARAYEEQVRQRQLLEPRMLEPDEDFSDATPEQLACFTRNDDLVAANEEYGGWYGDMDRRCHVAMRLARHAYKQATGRWVYQMRDDRLSHGFLGYDTDRAGHRFVVQVDPATIDIAAFGRRMNALAGAENRRINVPPGHEVSVLVQPGCFGAEEMLAVRDRMEARRYGGQVTMVPDFVGWDGRMQVWVHPDSRWYGYGEELRRREGPIIRVGYASWESRPLCPSGALRTRR